MRSDFIGLAWAPALADSQGLEAAAEAVDTEPGLVVVVVAAGAIGLWLLTLSIRNLRKPRS